MKVWVAKGGCKFCKKECKKVDKRNVVLEPESLKAWVAKGEVKILIKMNVVIIESMGWVAKGRREMLIKAM